jgi:hypothetical protein
MLLLHHSNSDFSGTYMYFLTPLIDVALIGNQDAAGLYIYFCMSSGLLTLRKLLNTSPHLKVLCSWTDRLET